MYRALASGKADVISAFSSDGRIAARQADGADAIRSGAIPGYDAILLLSPERARRTRGSSPRCSRWSARIPVEAMREANYMVDRDTDKATPDAGRALAGAKAGARCRAGPR